MNRAFGERLASEIAEFREKGVYKRLNHLESPQAPWVEMEGRGRVLVLSSNNYLGLSAQAEVMEAGRDAITRFGAGTASVRFICGTFSVHRELEAALASFVGTEAALTYVSCWNANTGLTASFLEEEDAVISDALNHASVIDGIRATKCTRMVYPHSDMKALETALRETAGCRHRFIFTDGIFSMEGDLCRLPEILELARRHDAIVAVDDSHGSGVMGATGRGVAEHFGVLGEVDVITSTLGKALGGAAGGFTAGPASLTDYLTQRSRPQLFSNALPPTVAGSALAAVRYVESHPERVRTLRENASYFRARLLDAGFRPLEGETPIIPIIVGETSRAIGMSEKLLDRKIFVTGFGYPVVPQGEARLRCQISAAHTREDMDFAMEAIVAVGRETGVIS
jgi:glycine C-acetyltransferase